MFSVSDAVLLCQREEAIAMLANSGSDAVKPYSRQLRSEHKMSEMGSAAMLVAQQMQY